MTTQQITPQKLERMISNVNTDDRPSTCTSQTARVRFTRTNTSREPSIHSRSKSRESESGIPIAPLFVKNICVEGKNSLKIMETKPLPALRKSITKGKNQQKQKQSIPIKNKKITNKEDKVYQVEQIKEKILKQQNYHIDIKLKQHQINLSSQYKNKTDKKIILLQDQLIRVKKQLSILYQQNQMLKNFKKSPIYQKNSLDNDNQSNNTMDKMKKSIKQNRVQQLAHQIKLLQQQIQKQNSQIIFYKENLQNLHKENIQLKIQVQISKNKIQKDNLSKIQSMRQRYLSNQLQFFKNQLKKSQTNRQQIMQDTIIKLQRQLQQTRNQLKSIQIKISIINKKNQQQMIKFKNNKNQQLIELRKKYSKLLNQYKNINQKNISGRNNLLNMERQRNNQAFILQLSPQP